MHNCPMRPIFNKVSGSARHTWAMTDDATGTDPTTPPARSWRIPALVGALVIVIVVAVAVAVGRGGVPVTGGRMNVISHVTPMFAWPTF